MLSVRARLDVDSLASSLSVVITTYGTLCGDFPDYKKHSTDLKRRKRLAKDEVRSRSQPASSRLLLTNLIFSQVDYDSDDSEWDEQQQRSKLGTGPMAQMEWYRVILDEAQLIRNRGTRMANAAFRLNAEYKWALTYVSLLHFEYVFVLRFRLTRFLHLTAERLVGFGNQVDSLRRGMLIPVCSALPQSPTPSTTSSPFSAWVFSSVRISDETMSDFLLLSAVYRSPPVERLEGVQRART